MLEFLSVSNLFILLCMDISVCLVQILLFDNRFSACLVILNDEYLMSFLGLTFYMLSEEIYFASLLRKVFLAL